MKILRIISLFALLLGAGAAGGVAAPEAAAAKHSFAFHQGGKTVLVWYYLPESADRDAPVVIVMHGVGRNGEEYLTDWTPLAQERKFLLVVPEFSKAEFPGDPGYNYGNTVSAAGQPLPRDQWAFGMIEPIFDAVRSRTGNRCETYRIFGHSAGAQFVQRFLYFVPQARVKVAVAANAGWYLLPDFGVEFPYGLKGTPVTEADLRVVLARPLTVLLGEADTNPKAKALRHTPEAEAQGPHRFARGQFFFHRAQLAAAALHTAFGWSLATAPGVGHSDEHMAPFAVRYLLPDQSFIHQP
ncbi:MAG: alpha/beta hydrolase [Verrucomicrobia bacterium]|nr:alpha/beta hydrolase [Verrucomicrobiota bacterium]